MTERLRRIDQTEMTDAQFRDFLTRRGVDEAEAGNCNPRGKGYSHRQRPPPGGFQPPDFRARTHRGRGRHVGGLRGRGGSWPTVPATDRGTPIRLAGPRRGDSGHNWPAAIAGSRRFRGLIDPGRSSAKRLSRSRPARDLDAPAQSIGQGVADVKPQAGALIRRFGGKKRIEDLELLGPRRCRSRCP